MRLRIARSVVGVGAVVVALCASGGTNHAEKVHTGAAAPAAFRIGDEVRLGTWSVKVYAVHDPQPQPPGVQIVVPRPGRRWVGVDVEVKNLGSEPDYVSALGCFSVRDAQHHDGDEVLWSGVRPGPPDGEVEPNDARRGVLVFDVPRTARGLRLRFECEPFSTGAAFIALS